jgi:peptidoglycan hydrolase-like protein with peptidoglycan-binding domain
MRLRPAFLIAAALLGSAAPASAQQWGFAPGMEAMYLRTIQEELARTGFYRGQIDGIDGPQTRQAIADWQRAAGQPVDGIPTTRLVEALRYGPRYSAPPRPAVDPVVRRIQQVLGAQGYYNGAPDGIYGPQTEDAIKQWQEDHGMQRTGRIDQALLDSLRAAAEPPPGQQQQQQQQPAPAEPAPQ